MVNRLRSKWGHAAAHSEYYPLPGDITLGERNQVSPGNCSLSLWPTRMLILLCQPVPHRGTLRPLQRIP